MANIHSCAEVAAEINHQQPPWMEVPYEPPANLAEIVQQSIDMFFLSTKPNGTGGGIGWWQTANAYTAIAMRDLYSKDSRNYEKLSNLLRKCDGLHRGFINQFNDDSLWWAMCCIQMYTASGEREEWFLDKAKAIWRHVRDSGSVVGRAQVRFREWDMEGGCFWKTTPSEGQINSISTGLYAECALRLALIKLKRSKQQAHSGMPSDSREPSVQEYIEAARSGLGWILRTRYRPRQGLVLDGFKIQVDKANDWTFTYTTGVAMAVSALLYEITRDEDYMTLAIHMAWKGMRRDKWVEEDGVLTEKNAYGPDKSDPAKDNDSVGFKSVFVRQLGLLYEVIRRTQYQTPKTRQLLAMIRQFININFKSQQERNTNGKGQYGPWWNGPFVMPTNHSQMAVLDVMATVVLVNK